MGIPTMLGIPAVVWEIGSILEYDVINPLGHVRGQNPSTSTLEC